MSLSLPTSNYSRSCNMIVEVALFFLVIILWLSLRNGKPHGFPPGPAGIPIFGYMPFLFKNAHITFKQLSEKYGPILGLKLGEKWVVVINDAKILREALKEDVFTARPNFPLFLSRSDGKKEGIIFSDGVEWQEQRRFALRNLRDFGFGKYNMEEYIHDQVNELLNSFRKDAGKPTDLRFAFNLAAINSLWVIITGDKFNYDDPKLKQLFNDIYITFEGAEITLNPDLYFEWLINIFPRLFRIKEFQDVTERIKSICQKCIQEHKETLITDSPRDFIDVYLKEIQSTSQTDSSFYGKRGEESLLIVMNDLFLAGSETTSSTLYWAILFLLLNPRVQEKLHKEIDEVVGRSRLPSLQDRTSMPYLDAFIFETLRHSSLIVFSVFHATSEDVVFHGYHIPKGTTVIPNLYAIHYDEKRWDDPKEFRPERFLTPEGTLKREEALIPFGTGKRQCLGEILARAELFLFLSGILQSFKFEIPHGETPTLEERVTFNRQAKSYNVVFKER